MMTGGGTTGATTQPGTTAPPADEPYWLDDEKAPDFARTVDIHRKPGFDPVELFLDPKLRLPKAKVGLRLLQKKLGFRYLMDVIPLDPSLVRGSHGRPAASPREGPLLITQQPDLLLDKEKIDAAQVQGAILQHLGTGSPALSARSGPA